jgi:activator of 2-hydroxyglutaryl-CoA dehydratase
MMTQVQSDMRIGVDAGGTFTDFVVLHDDGRLESFKLRSNPAAPAQVILEGLEQAADRGGTWLDGRHQCPAGAQGRTHSLRHHRGV